MPDGGRHRAGCQRLHSGNEQFFATMLSVMVGRKPKPSALKRLHGSTEPCNPDEPRPTGDLSAHCPPHLSADQRTIWMDAVASSPPGLLRRLDASVLETWAIAVDLQRRAIKELAEQDGLGSPAGKRLLTVIGRAGATVLRSASELGFSPTARPRTSVATTWRTTVPTRDDDRPRQSIEEYLASAPATRRAN